MKITDDVIDFSENQPQVVDMQETDYEVINTERKIVFRHGRAPGDNVMFTAGVRDFKLLFPDIKINVHAVPWRETDFDGAIIHVAAQDLKKISPFTDFVSPMCYSQMLKRDEKWIADVVADMDRLCPGKILPSIQVYPSYIDDVFTAGSFRKCLIEAIKLPSMGVVFFSWPLFEKDSSRMEVVKEVI